MYVTASCPREILFAREQKAAVDESDSTGEVVGLVEEEDRENVILSSHY